MQTCSTAVSSGEGERGPEGRKSGDMAAHTVTTPAVLFTLLHMLPSAGRLFITPRHVSRSWEVLSLSEEKATWLLLSEGEEGKAQVRWTSSDKNGGVQTVEYLKKIKGISSKCSSVCIWWGFLVAEKQRIKWRNTGKIPLLRGKHRLANR